MGGDVIRVRPSKSAIHTNGLQRYGGRVLPTAALPEAAAAKAAAIAQAAVERALRTEPDPGSSKEKAAEDAPAEAAPAGITPAAAAEPAAADEAVEVTAPTENAAAIQECAESNGHPQVTSSHSEIDNKAATEEIVAAKESAPAEESVPGKERHSPTLVFCAGICLYCQLNTTLETGLASPAPHVILSNTEDVSTANLDCCRTK